MDKEYIKAIEESLQGMYNEMHRRHTNTVSILIEDNGDLVLTHVIHRKGDSDPQIFTKFKLVFDKQEHIYFKNGKLVGGSDD